MKRTAWVLLACLAVGVNAADEKGTTIKFDGLSSTTPADWKSEKPANQMRFAQFIIPKAKGDADNGQLIIFKLGGTAQQNVDRWKGQFIPPEGKKIDDVAKVQTMKVAGSDVTYLDIHGTYLDGRPGLPAAQKKKRANYRMLAVQFDTPDNSYQILFRGPAKTVAEHKKGFETWVKGFKK
jgi:hypothetical protein